MEKSNGGYYDEGQREYMVLILAIFPPQTVQMNDIRFISPTMIATQIGGLISAISSVALVLTPFLTYSFNRNLALRIRNDRMKHASLTTIRDYFRSTLTYTKMLELFDRVDRLEAKQL